MKKSTLQRAVKIAYDVARTMTYTGTRDVAVIAGSVCGTNLDTHVMLSGANVTGEGIMDGKTLLGAVNGALDIYDGKARSGTATVTARPIEDYPMWPTIIKTHSVEVHAHTFAQAIARVAVCMDDSGTRAQLGAVHIRVADGTITVVASDGKRIADASMKAIGSHNGTWKCNLPPVAVKAIIGIACECSPMDTMSISRSDEPFARVWSTHGEVITREIEGDLPPYESMIPMEHPTHIRFSADMMRKHLRDAVKVCDRNAYNVRLAVGTGQYELEAIAKGENGEYRSPIGCSSDGEPVDVTCSIGFLSDLCAACKGQSVTLGIGKGRGALTATLGTEYRYCFMPVIPHGTEG